MKATDLTSIRPPIPRFRNSERMAIRTLGMLIAASVSAACSGHETVQSEYKTPEPPPVVLEQKMFLWSREAGFAYIPAQPGVNNVPYGINDLGEVVGTTVFGPNRGGTFVWSASTGFRYLDSAGVPASVAMSINTSGSVTGFIQGSSFRRAFVWSRNAGVTILPDVGGIPLIGSAGHAINSRGEIAGNIIRDTIFTAFRWSSEAGTHLLRGTSELVNTFAVDMNDTGEVIGYDGVWEGWDPVLSQRSAILWSPDGKPTDLFPECRRKCDVDLASINSRGEVAGTIGKRAFRRSTAGVVTSMPGSDVTWARGMNDEGDVIVAVSIGMQLGKASLWTVNGDVIELRGPPEVSAIYPHAINNKGVVVGTVR